MLYEIGVMLVFLSVAFCGGSVVIPMAIAGIGVGLMYLERRNGNDSKENTER